MIITMTISRGGQDRVPGHDKAYDQQKYLRYLRASGPQGIAQNPLERNPAHFHSSNDAHEAGLGKNNSCRLILPHPSRSRPLCRFGPDEEPEHRSRRHRTFPRCVHFSGML